jgi:putative transposase
MVRQYRTFDHDFRQGAVRLVLEHGAPRIAADLQAAGWRVSQNTVAQVLRDQHLRARVPRRRRATTRPGRGRWPAPDLIGRQFGAERVNTKWYGDGTEIGTGEGKLFLIRA